MVLGVYIQHMIKKVYQRSIVSPSVLAKMRYLLWYNILCCCEIDNEAQQHLQMILQNQSYSPYPEQIIPLVEYDLLFVDAALMRPFPLEQAFLQTMFNGKYPTDQMVFFSLCTAEIWQRS